MGMKYPGLLLLFLLPALIGIASGAIYVENATVFDFSLNTTSTGLNSSIDSVQPRIFTEHIDSILDPSLTTPSLELNNSLSAVRPRIFTEHIDSILGPSLTTPSLELNNSLSAVRPRIFTEHIDSILGPSLTTPSLELNNSLSAVRPRIFTEHIDSILSKSLTTPSLELNNSLNTVRPRIFIESADMLWFMPLINMTPDLTPPEGVTDLHETGIGTTWINWTWDNPNNTDFGHVIIYINGTWKANTSANYFNATGLNLDTTYEIAIKTADIWGNVNESSVQDTAKTLGYVADISPPSSVTDLQNTTYAPNYINWSWINPTDTDFSHVMVYLNGIFQRNITAPANFYNTTDVNPDTEYIISTHTVDTSWNINSTWMNNTTRTAPAEFIIPGAPAITSFDPTSPVSDIAGNSRVFNVTLNQTANVTWYINGTQVQSNESVTESIYTNTSASTGTWNVSVVVVNTNGSAMQIWDWIVTAAADTVPPASVIDLHASSVGTTWINWTWTNPSDFDFNHTMLYLDGSFVDNFSETYYNATNLQPGSIHTISTHTVDTSGNINQTWINDTALTAGDLSNGLNINVYKPENFSVYPVGDTLRFDIEVTDSAGNPVDSGISAYADLFGPNDASRQIILTKNGTNFTGEYIVQKDDHRGIWIANISVYNTTNSGRVSAKIIIIGAYIIQPSVNSRSYVIGETANFTARVVKPGNTSQILTNNNLSLNMTVYHFNSSIAVMEPFEMPFNNTAGLFYEGVDTGLLGSGLFTVVFDGKDTSGNVENASIMIGVSENFSITTSTNRIYYDRGEPVNIFGTVRFDNNSPISNASVSLQLNLQGYKRSYSVITNETGSYNYTFRPFAAEAGNYSVKATVSNIGLQRFAQSDFTIYGLYLSPQSSTINMVENSSQKINFTLYNLGDTKLTGIKSVIKDLDNSDTVTAIINPGDIPSELLPYNSTSITVQINAGTPVPDKAVFQLEVATDQNSNEVSELNVNLFAPTPIVKVYPENIQIGLNRNQTAIKTITITNIGYGLLKNVTLHQPNISWSRITSNTSLGDLNPGENSSFDVHINSYNVDLGTYFDTMNITSDNFRELNINITTHISDLNNGSLLFSVTDALGRNLSNANVSLINQETYQEFDASTNSTGYTLLENLPVGKYTYVISSDGTNTLPQTGTVEVEPMETPKLIEISLFMSFIDFDWEVTPTSIEDYYNIVLRMKFETDVPIPLLLALPPYLDYNMIPGEEKTNTLTLINAGLVSIYNVSITPNTNSNIEFVPLITKIDEIKAKSSIQVPYKIKLSSNATNCQDLNGNINIYGKYVHFFNGKEVTSYAGVHVPLLINIPGDKNCSSKWPWTLPNVSFCVNGVGLGVKPENLSVDPWVITIAHWFEWKPPVDTSPEIVHVNATNNNAIGKIVFDRAFGITASVGVSDVIEALTGVPTGYDVTDYLNLKIPFFDSFWSGTFNPNPIYPDETSQLDLSSINTGAGLTLPKAIGGSAFFRYGPDFDCFNCIWYIPIVGIDLSIPDLNFSTPKFNGTINITLPNIRINGTCWDCIPNVVIPPPNPCIDCGVFVPWDWPDNGPSGGSGNQIYHQPRPVVTQTIHETVKLSVSQNVTMERDAFWAGLGILNKMPDKDIANVKVSLSISDEYGTANEKFFIKAPQLKGISSLDGSGRISPLQLAT